MKYRSRSEIVSLILDAGNGGGATKTKLTYKAYLSFNRLKDYLADLLEYGLLVYEEKKGAYKTTEKGLRLLQLKNRMDEIAPINYSNVKNSWE